MLLLCGSQEKGIKEIIDARKYPYDNDHDYVSEPSGKEERTKTRGRCEEIHATSVFFSWTHLGHFQ